MADPINILSFYSGSGMHDEAVCAGLRLLGYGARVLGYVEREASAAAWLLGRMEAQAVESAPVFVGDLADLADGDCDDMRGLVDIFVASPPCQPYSSAGAKRGNADERSFGGDGRGPLHHTVRIIDRVRPALVWFENVPEWVTGGSFRGFGDALSRVGYAIQDPIFLAAEDVGAPHQRERVFILAVADAELFARRRSESRRRSPDGVTAARPSEELADSDNARPRPGIEGIEGIEGSGRDRSTDGRGQLAKCPGRGRRERGQSPGRDGLAARSDQELGDGIGGRLETHADQRVASVAADAGGELDHAAGPRRDGAGREPDAEQCGGQCVPASGRAELGIAGRSGRRTQGHTGEQAIGPDRSIRDIPLFPPGRGGNDDELAKAVRRADRGAHAAILHTAANDYRQWAALFASGLDPALAPCVERGLPALADGLAISNSDLLRLGGNGVVALAASVAFVEAVRRLRNK